jgi:glycine cleavage system H lipoate-binding protein/ABC-type phosphate transport system substrate-binding protein
MKRPMRLLICLLLINCINLSSKGSAKGDDLSPGDSLKVLSTPDLFNLSLKWAGEYNKLYPGAKIKVIRVSDPGLTENLIDKGNVGIISDEYSGLDDETKLKVVVGRDVIVPVINSKNPYLEKIYLQGVSREALVSFFNNRDSRNWGILLKGKESSPANYYRIKDESINRGLKGFLKTDLAGTAGTEVESEEAMISAIQKDPLSIGFCKLVDIMDFNNVAIADNIRLLPIDRNGDGTLEYAEKIYNDLNSFSRGVWIGKYPKTLFSNIYSVSSVKSESDAGTAFLKWIITDGQKLLISNGYSDLMITERQTAVNKLYEAKAGAGATIEGKSIFKPLFFIITGLILAGIVLDTIARSRRRKKAVAKTAGIISHSALEADSLLIPKGIYFDKTHTWSFMEQNGNVKVGVDDFLQHLTGTVTRVKMNDPGYKIRKGDPFLSIIQNGKQLNLYAPVSGVIVKKNDNLDTNASLINTSPYGDGWVYMIEPTNWLRENQLLFMAEKHIQHIKNELFRLKDFLASALTEDKAKFAMVILQDGGELRDGVLSELGPELWEDFQTKFLDPSRQVWFYEIF